MRRPEIDAGLLSWLFTASFIKARFSMNLEYTNSVSLSIQLPGISCLLFLGTGLVCGPPYHRTFKGYRGSELWSSCYPRKCLIHWNISLCPLQFIHWDKVLTFVEVTNGLNSSPKNLLTNTNWFCFVLHTFKVSKGGRSLDLALTICNLIIYLWVKFAYFYFKGLHA